MFLAIFGANFGAAVFTISWPRRRLRRASAAPATASRAGARSAAEALKTAVDLALPNGAALRVYTVARRFAHVPGASGDERGPHVPTEAEILREMLHTAVADLPAEARALPVFVRGFPDRELVEATRYGVDLLVLGSRAGGPVRRLLHHSVTSAVMREATCPVLISPHDVRAPLTALA